DISSNLWEKGGASVLFCAPLFLREWSGRSLTPEDEFEADQARLKRILKDLLGRVEDQVILCHSDLSVKGTEQTGPLLTLVNGSQEIE
ncbi:MAG: recombinase family protein, partial [Crocosphaera sp.]